MASDGYGIASEYYAKRYFGSSMGASATGICGVVRAMEERKIWDLVVTVEGREGNGVFWYTGTEIGDDWVGR